jgi:hypothetical protein
LLHRTLPPSPLPSLRLRQQRWLRLLPLPSRLLLPPSRLLQRSLCLRLPLLRLPLLLLLLPPLFLLLLLPPLLLLPSLRRPRSPPPWWRCRPP